ncbi:hypothetical protein NUW58_g8992 [Xylaria curta]|uniref:Uncharacterized protein n=1 Tax=Xylaria curta TaxID=42375 RepID=A0ACC1N3Z5_9PEZI|nr:hypothetical protein NUW58_g8992 [Xylaria curta]
MSEPHVVFDPDGDFLIIARSYASPFDPSEVPCREHDESESDGTEETVVDLDPDDKAQSTSSDTTVPDSVVPGLWVPDISVPDATVPDTMVPDTMVLDATIPDTAVTDATVLDATVPDAAVPDNSTPEVRCFKVSSAFLALYSAYFRRMMKGPYREAAEVHDDGLRHSEIEGLTWDAITIVLNIIHGNGDQVPETLELHELLEVARVVDYMKCQEAMEFYSHIWIHHLRHTIPKSYNCELLLWICIAGVFWDLKIFSRCTRVAVLENARGIPTLGLPVLPEIRSR